MNNTKGYIDEDRGTYVVTDGSIISAPPVEEQVKEYDEQISYFKRKLQEYKPEFLKCKK